MSSLPEKSQGSFEVWRRRQSRRRARDEALRHSVLEAVCAALDRLALEYPFEEAYLFGSVVNPGRFSDRSDVDVGVEGLDGRDLYRFVASLSGAVGREVDVVLLEESGLAPFIRAKGISWKKIRSGRS
jgi:uncharacterized protein